MRYRATVLTSADRPPQLKGVVPHGLTSNTMTDIGQFVRDYGDSQRHRIEFARNGKHASEFHDASQNFQSDKRLKQSGGRLLCANMQRRRSR